jgi:hypothetical protein
MVRAASSGSPVMVKAPMGLLELREDHRGVGSIWEGLRRCSDCGGAELGFRSGFIKIEDNRASLL